MSEKESSPEDKSQGEPQFFFRVDEPLDEEPPFEDEDDSLETMDKATEDYENSRW